MKRKKKPKTRAAHQRSAPRTERLQRTRIADKAYQRIEAVAEVIPSLAASQAEQEAIPGISPRVSQGLNEPFQDRQGNRQDNEARELQETDEDLPKEEK